MLKKNILRTIEDIPTDILFSAVVNAGHKMQYDVQKNAGHIEPDLNVLIKGQYCFNIDFVKTLFSITQRHILPSSEF